MDCFCCSGKTFGNCCQPFLQGILKPPTAEKLMRSRYSAYATVNIEYLLRSTHPSTRQLYQFDALKNWAEANTWQKLEIVSLSQGGTNDRKGSVEFKAYYLDSNGKSQTHHEYSNFIKELGKWFFVDGKH